MIYPFFIQLKICLKLLCPTGIIKHLEDNKSISILYRVKSVRVNKDSKELMKRGDNIYKIIKSHFGLRYTQLEEYLKVIDSSIIRLAFSRRISKFDGLIEFRDLSETGEYFIKD